MQTMQSLILIIILALNTHIIHSKSEFQTKHAITYVPHGGRVGDQICGYSRTKWLSHKYKIPFLFNPFVPNHPETMDLFKQLTMFYAEKPASTELIELVQKNDLTKTVSPYLQNVSVGKESDLYAALNKKDIPTLFICSFATKLDLTYKTNFKKEINEYICDNDMLTYLISLEKPFASKLKKMLKPIASTAQKLPQDRITVAVHIRTGGGYDRTRELQQYFDSSICPVKYNVIQINDKTNKITTLSNLESEQKASTRINISRIRFLPKQYYVDQIIKLSKLLNDKPLFIYIFTDEENSIALTNEIKNKVNLPNIEWGCRTEGNAHDVNIIEDFEAISQFDCLIRPHSNFSLGASLLGNHKIIIAPLNAQFINEKTLVVNEVNIIAHNLELNNS